MVRFLTVLVTALNLLAVPAHAADWQVDPAGSKIRFGGTHMGNGFEGVFEKWSAEILFDPANLKAAHVRVVVATGSAITGNKLYDGTLVASDWFDVENFQEATFEATEFTQNSEGNYTAAGTLTIKGKSQPLAFDFILDIVGGAATMTARRSLDRIDLGLGVQSDATASWVSREIDLNIMLKAQAH